MFKIPPLKIYCQYSGIPKNCIFWAVQVTDQFMVIVHFRFIMKCFKVCLPIFFPTVEEVKKEEPQKKKIKMGPHRESTKVKSLRRIPPLSMHKNGQLYVSINLFTHLFHNFKMDTSCLMSFLVMLFGDPSKDFVFKKWQITHLSLRAAQEIGIVHHMFSRIFLRFFYQV